MGTTQATMSKNGGGIESFDANQVHERNGDVENVKEGVFEDEGVKETATAVNGGDMDQQEDERKSKSYDNDADTDVDVSERDKQRESAIHKLLSLCAEQSVDVPPELRSELLNEKYAAIARSVGLGSSIYSELAKSYKEAKKEEENSPLFLEFKEIIEQLPQEFRPNVDLRIENGSFKVMQDVVEASDEKTKKNAHIETVASASTGLKLIHKLKTFVKTGKFELKKKQEEKVVMDGINLNLKHGKMYLILGAPGCGKSTLLKMIAGLLKTDPKKGTEVGGRVTCNGIEQDDSEIVWENLVTYVDQIDRLHPLMTVKETCDFAFDCRQGGTHRRGHMPEDDKELNERIEKLDEEDYMVNAILRSMGIKRVEDTFVGDDSTVRGVSGGERKRVTVAEMSCIGSPVECLDEMSTGLDAATTFDIVRMSGKVGRLRKVIRVISLLQPPPETVALFDEIILLDKGRIIYTGPVEDVVKHFEDLGYKIPQRMDPADWLQALPTDDGANFLVQPDEEVSLPSPTHLTHEQFVQKYNESKRALEIIESLNIPPLEAEQSKIKGNFTFTRRYMNSKMRSLKLLTDRETLLWWRNKYQLKARIFQDILMGIIVGTLFWQVGADAANNINSIIGVLFQTLFFVSLGAMMKIGDQISTRGVFYKQQDANFYPTWSFILGRSIAAIPTAIIDALTFGTIIYWFVGLSYNDGADVSHYFVFLLICLFSAYTFGLMFSVLSGVIRDKPTAQGAMAVATVIMILFSGFTVQPDVIPDYWIWVYWGNLFAWLLRGLVVNEFQSGKYDDPNPADPTQTIGEGVLERLGFTLNGEPFGFEWVWWGILFSIGMVIISVGLSVWTLNKIRFETGKALSGNTPTDSEVKELEDDDDEDVAIPFKRANLAFKDVHYYVQASTTNETLELLKGVDGFVEAGKLTALMGSSGAGKTTLMDVLSLRKSSGEIIGDVRVNGHPQEPDSFRRCTGYVEQFDTQSPQLTIRETVRFSAKLRLDENDPVVTDESIDKFVTQNLKLLELDSIESFQVGSDLGGGLSFEQRKRLSIAVELVANPSILFLDEPTSGLDARAASIVMRGLKRIAKGGRAVCATIHQPSVAIFNSFDSLLLLKRGGEPVFFGELGEESCNLISYLERYESTPRIKAGENPGTWMLTTIGAGSAGAGGSRPFDYAASYAQSKLREEALERIDVLNSQASDENLISYDTKYSTSFRTQLKEVVSRMKTIYWRSPSYNRNRSIIAALIALLFGSVYVSQQTPENESDMNSRVTSIYITSLFLAVSSLITVLPVYEVERNMFYRHKAARMYRQSAITIAVTVAEIPFLLLAAMIFCICWYFMAGFSSDADAFFLYYLFTLLNMAAFTFVGQMLMSLTKDSTTAQGLGAIFNSMSSLFSGVLLRPQQISGFWTWAYWVFPGHYVMEGLLTSQYHDDDTPIEPSPGSAYDRFVDSKCGNDPNCFGTASDWIYVSFGGKFLYSHVWYGILYMIGLILVSKAVSTWALIKLDYLAK